MRLTFFLFLGFAILVLALGHRYFYIRLFRDTDVAERHKRFGRWLLFGLFALTIAAIGLSRTLVATPFEILVMAAMIWLGCFFYLALFLGIFDLVKLGGRLRPRAASKLASPVGQEVNASAINESRRKFLARLSAGAAIASTGAIGGFGMRSAWGDFETPEVPIGLARFPRQLDGFKLVQISDVHIGPTSASGFIERIVEHVNALKPDCIVITGDLVDGQVSQIGDEIKLLGNLRSRFGTYFSTGNHEFYSRFEEWQPFLEANNMRVLKNQRVEIRSGRVAFDLGGVHDHHAPVGLTANVASIMKERDNERELVLLAHQPVQIDLAVESGAGLQLSGHTHGGQVFPFGYLTALFQPYLSGHHHHDANTQIYVSCGTGFWGPPMRVGAAPEITQLILHST